MNEQFWNNLTLEQKVEALRELVELLSRLTLEMSEAFTDIINQAVSEYRQKYNELEKELFGGGEP